MAGGTKKVLRADVWVQHEGESKLLPAGQELPKWAKELVAVRDKLFVTIESEDSGDASAGNSGSGSSSGPSVEDLKAELKKRELPQTGNKPELLQRIADDDAEKAKAKTAADSASGSSPAAGDTGSGD